MRWWCVLGLGAVLGACGGAPPPPAQPASKGVVTIVPSQKRPPPAPAPVSAAHVKPPKDLGGVMRSRSPASVWPAFGRLLPAVGGLHDVFGADPDGITTYLLGPTVARVVDLDQSVDAVQVGWGAKRRLVVSMGLIDLDDARAALADEFDLIPRDGALALEPHSKAVAFGRIGRKDACEIRAARGSAPYRLICGPRDALPRFAPWLARELAPRPLPDKADLWTGAVDVPNGALMDQLATLASGSEKKLIRLFKREARDFRYYGIGFAARDGSLDATLDFGLVDPHSVLGTEVLGQPDHARTLPKTFFRLPADTGLALYSVGAPPEKVHAQAGEFWDAVANLFADDVAPKDLPRFKAGLSRLFLTGGPSLVAYGFDVNGARSVLHRTLEHKPPKPAALTQAVQALQGWLIVELDEPIGGLRDTVRAVNAIPYGNTSIADPDKTDASTKEVPVRPAEHLPKGSMHLHTRTFQNRKYVLKADEEPAIPYSSEYYMVPDGNRTWMIWAASKRVALDKLHAVLGGKPKKTLAGRSDLQSLAKRKGNVLGFTTPAAATAMLLSSETKSDVKQARYVLDVLGTLPERGATPIPFVARSTKDPSSDAKYAFRASCVIPQSSLDEIVALVMAGSP